MRCKLSDELLTSRAAQRLAVTSPAGWHQGVCGEFFCDQCHPTHIKGSLRTQERKLDAEFLVMRPLFLRLDATDPRQLVEATRRAMERLDRLVRTRTLQAILGAR